MATRMLQRRGTTAEWAVLNVILGDGELGWERDTGVVKIGDGVTAWNDLETFFMLRTLVDAKGDLLVGIADNVVGRLAAGAPGNSLFVDVDGNLIWAVPYAGADRVSKAGDTMTGPLITTALGTALVDLGSVTLRDDTGYLLIAGDDGITLKDVHAANIYDNGQRVYSVNNPPAATDLSALATSTQLAASKRKWTKTFLAMGA